MQDPTSCTSALIAAILGKATNINSERKGTNWTVQKVEPKCKEDAISRRTMTRTQNKDDYEKVQVRFPMFSDLVGIFGGLGSEVRKVGRKATRLSSSAFLHLMSQVEPGRVSLCGQAIVQA